MRWSLHVPAPALGAFALSLVTRAGCALEASAPEPSLVARVELQPSSASLFAGRRIQLTANAPDSPEVESRGLR